VHCDVRAFPYLNTAPEKGEKEMTDGDSKMSNKTKIALAAALILGTASAALAGNDNDEEKGGYVLPGSRDGVNPALHPDIFGTAGSARNGNQAYGYVTAPKAKQTHRVHTSEPKIEK
jgi:hypothetical protein